MVEQHAKTLLPQYLAMYRITVNDTENYLLVMRNVFSPYRTIHTKYDIKVSRTGNALPAHHACTYFCAKGTLHTAEIGVPRPRQLLLVPALPMDMFSAAARQIGIINEHKCEMVINHLIAA